MITDIKRICAKVRIDMRYVGTGVLSSGRKVKYYRFYKKYKKVILFGVSFYGGYKTNTAKIIFYGDHPHQEIKTFKNKKAFLIFLNKFIKKNYRKF